MTGEDSWPVSFEANREDQLRRWAAASPARRLAWLEAAARLAYRSGARWPSDPPFPRSPGDAERPDGG